MKISYQWLREFVDVTADAPTLGRKVTDVGLALESCEDANGDSVLDLDVTTNRPDCLNPVEVAREVSAIYGTTLRKPQFTVQEASRRTSEAFAVSIDDGQLCGRYCARYLSGVKVGPSPSWIKNRLEAVGVRSINNIADVTNYVM